MICIEAIFFQQVQRFTAFTERIVGAHIFNGNRRMTGSYLCDAVAQTTEYVVFFCSNCATGFLQGSNDSCFVQRYETGA